MNTYEWITIFAILLAPLLAIQAQKYLELRREIKERKRRVFQTLMATRATTLNPLHVEALNMIDVEFYGNNKKNKRVVRAWKEYLDHLGETFDPADKVQVQSWLQRSNDLLIELLYQMAISLGYDFDKVHLKRGTYLPKAHGEIEIELNAIRKGFLEVLNGKRSIPMDVLSFPTVDNELAEQQIRNILDKILHEKPALPAPADEKILPNNND